MKSPADKAWGEYCHDHGLFYKDTCPQCELDLWDVFVRQAVPDEQSVIDA